MWTFFHIIFEFASCMSKVSIKNHSPSKDLYLTSSQTSQLKCVNWVRAHKLLSKTSIIRQPITRVLWPGHLFSFLLQLAFVICPLGCKYWLQQNMKSCACAPRAETVSTGSQVIRGLCVSAGQRPLPQEWRVKRKSFVSHRTSDSPPIDHPVVSNISKTFLKLKFCRHSTDRILIEILKQDVSTFCK